MHQIWYSHVDPPHSVCNAIEHGGHFYVCTLYKVKMNNIYLQYGFPTNTHLSTTSFRRVYLQSTIEFEHC